MSYDHLKGQYEEVVKYLENSPNGIARNHLALCKQVLSLLSDYERMKCCANCSHYLCERCYGTYETYCDCGKGSSEPNECCERWEVRH